MNEQTHSVRNLDSYSFAELPLVTTTNHKARLSSLASALLAIEGHLAGLPVIANRRVDLPTVDALGAVRHARKLLKQAANEFGREVSNG